MFLGGRGHFLALPWGPKLALLAFYAPLPRLILLNKYLKQKDFYRIFHHRRAAPFMFQLLLRCRCLYIHADPWQDYVTTLSNCSTATAPRFPRIYDFPGATRPGDVIFLAGFHPVVTTYKEYLKNQTNTSSPPRRASQIHHVFGTFMIFLARSLGRAAATSQLNLFKLTQIARYGFHGGSGEILKKN